ncbi:MAG: hypothetical protein KKF89_03855 [Nanoarchaeota archaeon]|nr:hypothetical protein [Nanoarchaeota archaeon]MBU1854831.1 hypothetical protein [Nanoarchaeota archaeon]
MNPALVAFLAIIIAVGCIVVAFRFGKIFFKLLTGIFLLMIIFVVIFGSLVVSDAMVFRDEFPNTQSLFLLEDDDSLLASVVLKPVYKRTAADIYEQRLINASNEDIKAAGNLKSQEDEFESDIPFKFSSGDEFLSYASSYVEDDFDSLYNSFYKVMVFDSSVFDGFEDEVIDLTSVQVSVGDVLDSLRSDVPLDYLANVVYKSQGFGPVVFKQEFSDSFGSDARSVLFSLALSEVLTDVRDVSELLSLFREKKLSVYPSSTVFKTLSGSPEVFTDLIENKFEVE